MDENIPPHLASGFQVLQAPEGLKTGFPIKVRYIPIEFGKGANDDVWIQRLRAV